jgi:Lar family restriction alleviation protein
MAELKPCPFCGGEAKVYDHFRIARGKTWNYFRVGCEECGLRFPKFSEVKEEAIEAWNRRAEDGK